MKAIVQNKAQWRGQEELFQALTGTTTKCTTVVGKGKMGLLGFCFAMAGKQDYLVFPNNAFMIPLMRFWEPQPRFQIKAIMTKKPGLFLVSRFIAFYTSTLN